MQYAWERPYVFDTAAIPKAAAEQLKMASAPQVKVLVWLACAGQGRFDAAACAACCGVAPAVCEEAFRYWVNSGLLTAEGMSAAPAATPSQKPAIPSTTPDFTASESSLPSSAVGMTLGGTPSQATYPTRTQVLQRKAEDAAFSALLETAAAKLGKILSPADMSVFLYLYQELSLPPEVILMAIGYAVQHGKGKMAYIEKTAIGWAQDGINTFEAAEAYLQKLEQCAQAWNMLCEWLSLETARPTVAQKEAARRWIYEWNMPREVIEIAAAYTAEKTGKFQMNYADRVMERLYACGAVTADAAKAELTAEQPQKKKTPSKSRMKTATDRAPSYDMADYEKMVRRHRPTPPKED